MPDQETDKRREPGNGTYPDCERIKDPGYNANPVEHAAKLFDLVGDQAPVVATFHIRSAGIRRCAILLLVTRPAPSPSSGGMLERLS